MKLLDRLKEKILERTGKPLDDDPIVAKTICEVIEERIEEIVDERLRALHRDDGK